MTVGREVVVWGDRHDDADPRSRSLALQSRAAAGLIEWSQAADAAYGIAQRLAVTAFVPESFHGKPVELAAAILAGTEIGLSPLAAASAFDVIDGRAAARAVTLRAVVQAAGHDVELVESTSSRCVMRGRRAGTGSWQKVVWTLDRARDLKLTGKRNWTTQPTAMLVARATSEICRLVAADAILGIGGGVSAEEVADGAQVPDTDQAANDVMTSPAAANAIEAPPGTRRMSRAR